MDPLIKAPLIQTPIPLIPHQTCPARIPNPRATRATPIQPTLVPLLNPTRPRVERLLQREVLRRASKAYKGCVAVSTSLYLDADYTSQIATGGSVSSSDSLSSQTGGPTQQIPSSHHSPPIGAIVGGILGALLTIMALVIIFLCMRRRRRRIGKWQLYDALSSLMGSFTRIC
ncbi:hypothetical protein C8J57DRAFT_150671 [Mycena rebaudengoi]|nr:hypothetical protein C8J57DRAFT_150671 [Mycena rebaudengoi]